LVLSQKVGLWAKIKSRASRRNDYRANLDGLPASIRERQGVRANAIDAYFAKIDVNRLGENIMVYRCIGIIDWPSTPERGGKKCERQ
jgi:hypothetical protein